MSKESENKEDVAITLVSSDNQVFTLSLIELDKECAYIESLLRSGMRESQNKHVQLSAVSGSSLDIAVKFLRGNSVELHMKGIEDVLMVATYLQIPALLEKCGEFLLSHMDVDNIQDVIEMSKQFSLQIVESQAQDFLHRNIPSFSDTPAFLEMDSDDVISLLSADDLEVMEMDVLKAAAKWFEHDKRNRFQDVQGVLEVVRFFLMTGDVQLEECLNAIKRLGVLNKRLEDRINQARLVNGDVGLVHSKPFLHISLRQTVKSALLLGGCTSREHSTNRLQQFPLQELTSAADEPLRFRSQKCEKLPTTLCEHSACVLDNFVYVAGGQTVYSQNGRFTNQNVYRYDPRFFRWTKVCSMQTPRSLFHLGVLEGRIYAVAGWKAPNTVNKSVERYIPCQNKWEFVASLSVGLHEHAGCSCNSKLYITGGFKGPQRGHLDLTWRFDPAKNEWESLAPMLHARSYHAMVAIDTSKLLVIGGVNHTGGEVFEDVQACELLDIPSNQWSVVSFAPRPASCMGHFVWQNQIYLLGGHSFAEHKNHSNVQVLDTVNMTWKAMTMSSNKILHSPVVIVDLPSLLAKEFL